MPDLITNLKQKGLEVSIFPIHEYWLDIGRKESLEIADKDWNEKFST